MGAMAHSHGQTLEYAEFLVYTKKKKKKRERGWQKSALHFFLKETAYFNISADKNTEL